MAFKLSFRCAKQLYTCLSELKTNGSLFSTHLIVSNDAMSICEVLSDAIYVKIRYHAKTALEYSFLLPDAALLNFKYGEWIKDYDENGKLLPSSRFLSTHFLIDYDKNIMIISVQLETLMKALVAGTDNQCFTISFDGENNNAQFFVNRFSENQAIHSSPMDFKFQVLALKEDAQSIQLNAVLYDSASDRADYTIMLDVPDVICRPIKDLMDLGESSETQNAMISITNGATVDSEGKLLRYMKFDLTGGLAITLARTTIYQRENNGEPYNAEMKRRRTKQSHMIAEQCPDLPGAVKTPGELTQFFRIKLLKLLNILSKTCGRTTLVMKKNTPLCIRGIIGPDTASVMLTIMFADPEEGDGAQMSTSENMQEE